MPEATQSVAYGSSWPDPPGGVSVALECLSAALRLAHQTLFSSQLYIHQVPKFRSCLGIYQSARKQSQCPEGSTFILQV